MYGHVLMPKAMTPQRTSRDKSQTARVSRAMLTNKQTDGQTIKQTIQQTNKQRNELNKQTQTNRKKLATCTAMF